MPATSAPEGIALQLPDSAASWRGGVSPTGCIGVALAGSLHFELQSSRLQVEEARGGCCACLSLLQSWSTVSVLEPDCIAPFILISFAVPHNPNDFVPGEPYTCFMFHVRENNIQTHLHVHLHPSF